MTEKLSDQAAAAQIRFAVENLHNAISAAAEIGLETTIQVLSVESVGRPTTCMLVPTIRRPV